MKCKKFKSLFLIVLFLFSHNSFGNDFSFGLEIEFRFDREESKKIMNYYEIPASQIYSNSWYHLDLEERYQLAKKYRENNKQNINAFFKKTNSCEQTPSPYLCTQLPKKLEFTYYTVEFNGFIFYNLHDLRKFYSDFVKEFGEGDIQTHLVFPWRNMKNTYSLSLIEHDISIFRRISEEYQQYKKGLVKEESFGKILTSPCLGPMSEIHRKTYLNEVI